MPPPSPTSTSARTARTTKIVKSRGGDQGDAVTAILFPLVYRTVTSQLQTAALAHDGEAREYAYQDDAELICLPSALPDASAAYEAACKKGQP